MPRLGQPPPPSFLARLGLVAALLAALLPLVAVPFARAQPAAPLTAPLDLAAITLTPPDVAAPDFALAGGGDVPLVTEARRLARARGQTTRAAEAAVHDALRTAGWRRRYQSRLAAPDPGVPNSESAAIVSAVTEFADPAAAAAAFAWLAPAGAATAARPARGLIPLADESRLERAFVPAPAGADRPPARRLELLFRRDDLIGSVAIVDFSGERGWGVLAVEGLAAALLARLDAVVAGAAPNLSPRLLRPDGLRAPPLLDLYDRLSGETFPLAGVDPEDAADRERLYGAASDVYGYEAQAAGGVGAPYYAAKLYRFPDAGSAAAWLEQAPGLLFDDPGSFLDLAPVEDAATIGDASRTLSYGFPAGDDVVTRGYRVYARLGREVARVQLDAAAPVPLAAVEELARLQIACLAAPACRTPAPLPALPVPETPAAGG